MAMAMRKLQRGYLVACWLLALLAGASLCAALPRRGPRRAVMSRVCSRTPYPRVCMKEIVAVAGTKVASKEASFLAIVLLYSRAAAATASQTLAAARGLSLRTAKDLRAPALEKQALKDCIQLLSDAHDQLRSVIPDLQTFGSLKAADRRHRISDVRTWASAGLTDQDTCSDEMLPYREAQAQPLKLRLSYLFQVISNALYLLANLPSSSRLP